MNKLDLIFDRRVGDKKLYHYTNAIGFLGIVQNNMVWATDYTFMNDPSEHIYGHELVEEVLKETYS